MHSRRLQALVSLIAQPPIQQQTCLSDEQLIGFINHELKGGAFRHVKQHLQACPDCYREWQETCDFMVDAPNINAHKTPHWIRKIPDLFSMQFVLMTGSVFASIFAIMLLLPVFYQNSLQQQINQSYQQLVSLSVAKNESNETIQMAMMDDAATGFGFSASAQLNSQQIDFQKGIDVGGGVLKQFNSSKITHTDYYEFGRWIALLEQATQFDKALSLQFWQQQQSILQVFKQDFINNNAVIAHLDKLTVILQQLPNTEKLSLYDKLYRYTDFIQQDLGYRTP
ncbi:MAG: hypothetical protein VSS52_009195 [Thiotrichaceae bacterium]|nr:hypothetical protein [Thiotrichaceae bacterium]